MTQKIDISQRAAALVSMSQAVSRIAGGMLGPGEPPLPADGNEQPRLYEYQPGINLVMQPRAGHGLLSFQTLRELAEMSKEIRANIELIKRTMRGMKWTIKPRRQSSIEGWAREIESVLAFWERPDGTNSFDAWLNMVLEDLLVIDAVTIYPRVENGRLEALEVVDGATIRPLIDTRGAIPKPPLPAYLQVINGMAAAWFSADALIYSPLNTRANTPYGTSPIEWAIMAFNTAIRHDLQRLGAFTDGNIPGVLVAVDMETITPQQIEIFQQYFDELAKGDIYRASKILFVPSGGAQTIFQPTQPDADKIEVDRWLMWVACWAFGNNPAEFGLVPSPGLGGTGYVQGMENAQFRSMIGPISGYLESLFTDIIARYMGRSDLRFVWEGLEPPEDKLKQAQIYTTYINAGVYPTAYVQELLGVPEKYRAVQQAVPAVSAYNPNAYNPSWLNAVLERAARYELAEWRKTAIARKKKGEQVSPYVPAVLPPDIIAEVEQRIREAPSPDAIAKVFEDMLSGNVLVKRLITPAAINPLEALRRAGEDEMQAAISEYFEGLLNRIIAHVTGQPEKTTA